MVIFLQYTLTDYRRIISGNGEFLKKPSWPSPLPSKEFVKYSGQIIQRSRLGIDNWIGETFICKINKGIRVHPEKVGSYFGSSIKCVAKHQFSTEQSVLTKFELVFVVKLFRKSFDYNELARILNIILEKSISIKIANGTYSTSKVGNCIQNLKEHYILNTTKNIESNISSHLAQIDACTPQVFFALDKSESLTQRPPKSNQFVHSYIRTFYSSLSRISGALYRIWVHETNTRISLIRINREFRISILRIHSEYECLKNVLRYVTDYYLDLKRGTEFSENLQYYIRRASRTILADTKQLDVGSYAKSSLAEFILLFSQINPGEFDAIKEKIDYIDIRRQVKENVKKIFINNPTNVTIMEQNNDNRGAQIGALGIIASADNNNITQSNYSLPENLNYDQLATELGTMKMKMKMEASSDEEFASVVQISHAELEAKKKNGSSALKHLNAAGKWALDFATKVSATLVAEIIKNNAPIFNS